jgi:hypothetical protein
MALVFAVPFVPTAPPRPWIGLGMTWTGWDGSLWNLTRASEGVVMLPGLRGLTMPPVVHYTTAYPSVDGARWRGHAIDPREVFWPIQVFCDTTSQAWVARDRAFWKTMRPDKTGIWTVTQPSGEERTLTCRFDNDGDAAYSHDPVLQGWSNYGITMKANEPFWRGTPVKREWVAGAPVPFFPTGSEGFSISSSRGLDNARMPNPGDVQAFPVWELAGPITGATVGLAGKTITVPFTIDSGDRLVIDTDPAVQTALLYSGATVTDKTADLGTANFVAIPADDSTPITLAVSGAGKVTLTLTPLYLRAW